MRWVIRDSMWAHEPTHTIEVEFNPATPPRREEVEGFLAAVEPFLSNGAISALVLNGTTLRRTGRVLSYPEFALPVRYAAARCRSASSSPEARGWSQHDGGEDRKDGSLDAGSAASA